jgi:UPF0716 protein FxsA
MWLIAIILGLPLLEIALFVTLGAWLGLWATLAIVIGTAFFGIWLIRSQGTRAQNDLRAAMSRRQNPVQSMAGDVLVVVAGVLLVLPGFFTDSCGLLLLLPPVQRAITRSVTRRARERMDAHMQARAWEAGIRPSGQIRPDEVIDTTWEELPADDRKPGSGWTRH